MKLLHVVGARPNFMKAAPVIDALNRSNAGSQILLHTGQHYDENMSRIFFDELGLPTPDANLEVGSGSHAKQTAEIMIRIEQYLLEQHPDLVIVYGDINSTVAATLTCTKIGIPVAHVEAGLRSFDRTMPEEINRLVTDQIANYLFTPSPDGDEHLLNEGIAQEKIFLVGNVMIDTLVRLLPKAKERNVRATLQLPEQYGLITLHRPSNVDDPDSLVDIMTTLNQIGDDLALVFPIHPRTRKRLADMDVKTPNIQFLEPQGYLDFVALQSDATVVITDSGGIQEETTYMGVPCLTVRENTERPITITVGTNTLIGKDMDKLKQSVQAILTGQYKSGKNPELWDGQASNRIADIIVNHL